MTFSAYVIEQLASNSTKSYFPFPTRFPEDMSFTSVSKERQIWVQRKEKIEPASKSFKSKLRNLVGSSF